MLKIRVIPTLLWKNVGLVKGVSFDSWRRVGTVLPAITVYNTREVDELILLDIIATEEDRDPDYDSISDLSRECFVPLTVGGGIRNIEQIKRLLRSGADKVSINSEAYSNPSLITKAANFFGSQCIVVSIDASRSENGRYECYSHSGTRPTGFEISEWAKEMEDRGAGELLITSIQRDGTMTGYDIELLQRVAEQVRIPVIASGGAGNYGHMKQAIVEAGVSAVAAASIFHFTEQTPKEAKSWLANEGIKVRNSNAKLY